MSGYPTASWQQATVIGPGGTPLGQNYLLPDNGFCDPTIARPQPRTPLAIVLKKRKRFAPGY